ncbi:hypothetical protein AMAG_10225 [Allomyces macrogynus ATCC 38327]|uniref:RING-type domain-containing protein n=1 Tax=Allomyces macrogynus (strain ATCC 38327) TaxID=578462 RepID=A0A0L0SU53_ALLM3|nr:hypothetical protein AMAG_10225 [Allomyces macrogynus ATCC 38327]|eukprot:KNE65935.1 hypothetical protein AMAG_10225 [Allomyces macrogynus ATCC 38327]
MSTAATLTPPWAMRESQSARSSVASASVSLLRGGVRSQVDLTAPDTSATGDSWTPMRPRSVSSTVPSMQSERRDELGALPSAEPARHGGGSVWGLAPLGSWLAGKLRAGSVPDMSSATSSMPLAVAYWRRAQRGSVLRSVPEPASSDDRDWIHTSLDSLTSAGSDEWVPPERAARRDLDRVRAMDLEMVTPPRSPRSPRTPLIVAQSPRSLTVPRRSLYPVPPRPGSSHALPQVDGEVVGLTVVERISSSWESMSALAKIGFGVRIVASLLQVVNASLALGLSSSPPRALAVAPGPGHRAGTDIASGPGNGSTLVVFHALCLIRAVILLPNLLLDLLWPGSAEDVAPTDVEHAPSSTGTSPPVGDSPGPLEEPSPSLSGAGRPSWAQRLDNGETALFVLLFLLANYAILAEAASQDSRPALFYGTVVFLVYAYLTVLMPVLLLAATMFCMPCLVGIFSALGLTRDPVDALAELLGYASFTRDDDDSVLMGLLHAELATLVVAEYMSQPPPSSPPVPPSAATLSSPRLSIVPVTDTEPVSPALKGAKSLGRSSSRGSSATARSAALRRPWWMRALAPRAVTTATVRAAPTAPAPARPAWRVHVHDSDHAQCTICLTAYAGSDLVRVLPGCGHHFHGACVDPWLREHAPTCPLCQADLVPAVEAAAAVRGAVPLPSPVGGVLWRVEEEGNDDRGTA